MSEIVRWELLRALDEKLLKGGVILSEWCTFLCCESDSAYVKGSRAEINQAIHAELQAKGVVGREEHRAQTIRLNTELAKKPKDCLEYIVVHEMAHLLEPTHNAHFIALMDRFMPSWRHRRDQLNQLPVRHEEWAY
jgi:hypothetical protein